MLIFQRLHLKLLLILIIIGQLLFACFSSWYTAKSYEGKIYSTIGVELLGQQDLQKLNEAAHFFGQTIIGWTKFPNFEKQLKEKAGLPASGKLNARMQERQNIIFTVSSREPVTLDHLYKTKNYLQNKLIEYNESSSTGFTLSNLDYETAETTRPYPQGAGITLLIFAVLWIGWLYFKTNILTF